MFYVNDAHCTGCGTCVDVCPAGAIHLVNNIAHIDQDRCNECEACIGACPNGAILMVTEPVKEKIPLTSVQPASQDVLVQRQSAPVPLRTKVLPVVGVALSFLGHQIAPRLASHVIEALDRRLSGQPGTARSSGTMGIGSQRRGGRRSRQRRRGR